MLWCLRRQLPVLPVDSILDNLGAVQAWKRIPRRLPISSQDVWDEIRWFARKIRRHYGQYTLRWRRGHPETRKKRSDWTWHDHLNDLSDGLADVGRHGSAGLDPSSTFTHGRRWHVCYDSRRIFDDTVSTLLHQLGLRRLRRYQTGATFPRTPFDDWLRRAYCGVSKDVISRAMTAKFVLEQLATQERAAAWGYPMLDLRCRLCGVDGVHENLRHLLLDCSHPKLIDVRRKFVQSIVAQDYLQDAGLRRYIRADSCELPVEWAS